jgi:hypothetical protein
MINEKGAIHQVKCEICTLVEGKENLLVLKLNNLLNMLDVEICLMS